MRSTLAIGIAGGTGSGKTTLARCLLQAFAADGACLLDQDAYYLDRSHLSEKERLLLNYDEPQAIDHALLLRHLTDLIRGAAIQKPSYCFQTHTRKIETQTVGPAKIILLEGLFALWDPSVRELLDFRIYVHADADIRFIRRARRDILERGRTIESIIDQYLMTVRPMHEMYIEPTRACADLVLSSDRDDSAGLLATALQAINGRFEGQLDCLAPKASTR